MTRGQFPPDPLVAVCADCQHSAVYEETGPHMRNVRYCEHSSAEPMQLCEQARASGGFCGPGGVSYEAAA